MMCFSHLHRSRRITFSLLCFAAIFALTLVGCGGSSQSNSSAANSTNSPLTQSNAYGIAALNGYQISLFTAGSSAYSAPDSAVVDGGHVFLDYQNKAAKDGSDNKTSTIVEYTMAGKVLKTWSCPGHSDGMRMDPSTKLLWVISNEDGNPKMETIDPNSGTVTPYTFAKTPHGGGYDDVYFINGSAFISASNPTLNKSGNNVFPAVDKITLSNGKAMLTPILMGNATATDITSGANKAKVTLNEIDPDSLSTDPQGDLVLMNQAGSEVVFISNPGNSQQKVTRLAVGSQLDDTVWATSTHGRLLVVDGSSNKTYWIRANFVNGTVYTELPDDSGVAGVVATLDTSTGTVHPIAIGFGKPTGLLFVPDTQS